MPLRYWLYLALTFFLAAVALPAQAQEFGRSEEITATGVSYHVFVRAGEPSVQVMVMGSGGTGIYDVGVETTLSELVVLSGAASLAGQNKVTVRLLRDEIGTRRVVYESAVEEFLEMPSEHPDLEEGDVLVVEIEEHQRFGWRDGLSVVSALSSLTVVVIRILGIL